MKPSQTDPLLHARLHELEQAVIGMQAAQKTAFQRMQDDLLVKMNDRMRTIEGKHSIVKNKLDSLTASQEQAAGHIQGLQAEQKDLRSYIMSLPAAKTSKGGDATTSQSMVNISLSESLASMEEKFAEMKTIQYEMAEKFVSMFSAQEDIMQLSQDVESKSTRMAGRIEDLTCRVSCIQGQVDKQEQASHRCIEVMDKMAATVMSPRQDDTAAAKLQTLPVLPVKHKEDADAASVISVTTEATSNVDLEKRLGIGDVVQRKGELCRISRIDNSLQPPSLELQKPCGSYVSTEIDELDKVSTLAQLEAIYSQPKMVEKLASALRPYLHPDTLIPHV